MRDEGIGIAFSGGGFRATLFHVGALQRLNELGLLPQFREVTSVSGGSIMAAFLALRWQKLAFADGVATNLGEVVSKPLREFCSRTIDVGSILAGIISPVRHPSQLIEKAYRKRLFGEATLADLPDKPRFTIYATSLQTGRSVRFFRNRIADYRIGIATAPDVQIATAVAASSAFPPPLCPVTLRLDPAVWEDQEGADLYAREELRTRMLLGDGGIYDNLGMQRIGHNYTTVLVSDGGAPFGIVERSLGWRFSQIARARRALGIITDQARGLRKHQFIDDLKNGVCQGTYWGIGTQIKDYELEAHGHPGPLCQDTATTAGLARLRTRLNRFSDEEQERLINWGYALTDAAMRRHVLPPTTEPGALPHPNLPM